MAKRVVSVKARSNSTGSKKMDWSPASGTTKSRLPRCDSNGIGMMEMWLMATDPAALVRAAQAALAADDCARAHALLVEAWRAVAWKRSNPDQY